MPLNLPTESLDLKVVIVELNNAGNLRNLQWYQILGICHHCIYAFGSGCVLIPEGLPGV